jgi:octaheme c-type cytochrome (tetrathionate reductase family)
MTMPFAPFFRSQLWKATVFGSVGTLLLAGAGLPLRAQMPALPDKKSTADHATFGVLQKQFQSGPEVTAACLTCHTEAAKQMMESTHWTWRAKTGGDASHKERWIGKGAGVINNFCLGIDSSEPRCTSCHAGYGWKDKNFDFHVATNVDCLVCHDTTGTYRKFPTDAGHPNYVAKEWPKGSGKSVSPPDLGHIARHVGPTSRATCGSCHFFGGGSEGVKHGVLDGSLVQASCALDVHMSPEGGNFTCTTCHTTVNHQISGRYYDRPASETREYVMRGKQQSALGCETCHGAAPHHTATLNHHTDKVACQACHIPQLAPAKPTKMWWDWSQAGQLDPAGKPVIKKAPVASGAGAPRPDAPEAVVYDGAKGVFIWAWKAVPEYAWFNNHMGQKLLGEPIDVSRPGSETGATHGLFDHLDLSKPVFEINPLEGDYHDPRARLWPVKIHRGIQPYDPINKQLVVPKLFPNGPDADKAYWKTYNWEQAIEAGMSYANLPYSGHYAWLQTSMNWPLSHMVAPKEQSLSCAACHHPTDSRLAGVTGFYMPARDRNRTLDQIGWLATGGTLCAVALHGLLRIYFQRKRKKS